MLQASLKHLKIIFPLLFLLGIYTPLFAQSFLTDARQYSVEDGLSGRYVTDIQEDQRGLFWISTWLGLNRFDGFEFKSYPKEDYGLRYNKYEELLIDPNGNIWLTLLFNSETDMEVQLHIDIFNPTTEQVENEKILSNLPFKLENIHSLRNDEADNIWIGLKNGEIFKYDGQSFQKIINVPAFYNFHIVKNNICILLPTKDEIQFYDLKNNLIQSFSLPDSIISFNPTPQGEILTLSTKEDENNSNNYKSYKAIWTKYHPEKPIEQFQFRDEEGVPLFDTLGPFDILYKVDFQENIWISNNKTIALFDKNHRLIHDFQKDIPEEQMTGNYFFFDNQQRTWAATAIGIFAFKIYKNRFSNYLGSDKLIDTRGIAEDSLGNIYMNQSGTFYLNTKTNQIERTKVNGSRAAMVASNGNYYAGNYSPGVLEYNPKTTNVETIFFKQNDVGKSRFGASNICFQSKKTNKIYVGTSKRGLHLLDLKQQEVIPFLKINEFDWIQNSEIFCSFENEEGIWLGTSRGLVLLDEQQGIKKHYPLSDNPDIHIGVISIHIDKEKNYWLGTMDHGLFKLSASKKQILHLTTENGLTDNTIYAVYEDDAGYLWLSSNQGLMQLNKATLEVKTYLPSDGIPHEEFNTTSHLQASDGRLYFGGLKGVTAFYPKDFHQKNTNAKSSAPTISEVSTLDRETGSWEIRTQEFLKNQYLKLKTNHLNLKIQLAGFDMLHSEKNQYAYRLNQQVDWTFLEKNTLELKDLSYGKSNIQIKGRVRNGDWSQVPLSISFSRSYPFYLQFPFLLGILLLIGIIGFIFRKRQQKSKATRNDKIKEAISAIRESLAPPEEVMQQPTEEIKEKETAINLPSSASDEWLKVLNEKANQLIDDGKFSIIDLAESMNLSERQFRRRLKQKTDMAPKAYLNEIRLQKAKQLLIMGTHPTVAEVCYAVGFSTPKHFSKIFQEKFGNNPSFYLDKKSGKQNS